MDPEPELCRTRWQEMMARQQRSTPPPRRRRMNPVPLVLAAVVALGIIGAMAAGLGRGGGDQAAATFNVDCQHWCGSGTATISFGGSSATVSGGGCWDSGAD